MKRFYRKQTLAIKVVFAYAFWSSLWILLSDQALKVLFSENPELLIQISTLKGWVFTLVTASLLYFLIRSSERSRLEAYHLLADIIEGTTDSIFVKDRQGKYLLVNRSAASLVHKPISEILGKDDYTIFSTADALKIRENDEGIMASGKSQQLEETVTINDSTVTYFATKFPRFDDTGKVIGLIGISRNITERKQLQQERENLLQELQVRNKELNALNLITANAVSTLDLDSLLSVLLDRLVNIIKADLALIFLWENDELSLKAQMGEGASQHEDNFILNKEIARLTVNTRRLINIEDIQQDMRFNTYAAQSPEKRHVITIPLQRQKHFVGVLQISWHCPYAVSDREIHLLEIVAERCTMAILNAQLFQETQSLKQYLELQFERSPIALILHDQQGYITDWNPAAERIFGYTKAEVVGKLPYDLIIPESERAYVEEIIHRLGQGEMDAHGFNQNLTRSGNLITCSWHNTPLIKDNGEVVGILSMVQDVTRRTQLEKQLRRYAYYDPLTKLPIRRSLEERIQTLLETEESLTNFALFHLDLIRFKTIKYSLGYNIAEELLSAIAHRIQTSLSEHSFLARIGTDEFAILIENVETIEQAIEWVETIKQWFSTPFNLGEQTIFSDVNIGLVLSSQCLGSVEDILQAADTAMQQARFSASDHYAIFDSRIQEIAVERLRLDGEMRQALENNEFQVYYQPILNLKTQELTGFETLIRWQKDGDWISPATFIPLAEETGFIIFLDRWVLHQACLQMQQWCSTYEKAANLTIGVNVSVVDLTEPNFLDELDRILAETGLNPQQLKLEITETAVMENPEQISLILEQLQQRSIALCLDDFGTGYSSLSYLREFSFQVMKIDRAFISDLEEGSKHYQLIETMVLLANSLEMEIVVEGIETAPQLAQLKQLGCHQGQGYLFSRAIPSIEVEAILAQDNWIISL